MASRHDADDPAPVDEDPTGMRALLSSLPDPGPMPPDLVDRIAASIAAERASAPSSVGSGTGVDELAVHRSARRRGPSLSGLRWMAVAATVLGIVVIGSLPLVDGRATWSALLTGGSGDSSASGAASGAAMRASGTGSSTPPPTWPAASGAVSHSVSGSSLPPTSTEGAPPSEPTEGGAEVPGSGASPVTVYRSGQDYTSDNLAARAATLGTRTSRLHPLGTDSPAIGAIGTAKGAWACATALGVPSGARLTVDVATFAGRSAAILRADTSTGTVAYAVKRSCTTGSPGLLSGPALVG